MKKSNLRVVIDKKDHLKFANDPRSKPIKFLEKITLSDETKIKTLET